MLEENEMTMIAIIIASTSTEFIILLACYIWFPLDVATLVINWSLASYIILHIILAS